MIGNYSVMLQEQIRKYLGPYGNKATDSLEMLDEIITRSDRWSISANAFPMVWNTDIDSNALDGVRLPYKEMIIEYDFDYEALGMQRPSIDSRKAGSHIDASSRIIIAMEGVQKSGPCINILSAFSVTENGLKTFATSAAACSIPLKALSCVEDWYKTDKNGLGFTIDTRASGIAYFPSLPIYDEPGVMHTPEWMKSIEELGDEIRMLLGLLQIIQCDNAPIEKVTPKASVNKKRQKRGRPQIPTYRTLKISSHKQLGKRSGSAGMGSKKRAHWRRGHIRNQPTAKGVVRRWIKPVIVGSGNPTKLETVLT